MITDIKQKLAEWLEKNRPIVVGNHNYFIICRSTGMHIVRAHQLRIGDIRIITLPGDNLVKGLSDDEWMNFASKVTTLRNVIDIDL